MAARGRGLDYMVIAKVGPTVAARGVTVLYYCQSTVAPRGRVSGSIIWYPVHRYDNHICKSLLFINAMDRGCDTVNHVWHW